MAICGTSAIAETEPAKSILRASYHYKAMDTDKLGAEKIVEDEFILQIAPRESHFFSLKTYEYEKLMATEEGKKLERALIKKATTRSKDRVDIDLRKVADEMPKRGERTRVWKYHDKGSMEVYNNLPGEDVVYTVRMDDLTWTLTDSVKNILGYECQQAVADYHGRRWIAWFAPEVPVQEGPWQLCGLSGLIFEAQSEGGEFSFEITSLEQESQPMIEFQVNEQDLFRYDRKVYLREKRSHKEDPAKFGRAWG